MPGRAIGEQPVPLGRRQPEVQRQQNRADPRQPTTEISNRPGAPLRDTDPAFFDTAYVWNDNSQLVRKIEPNGNITENVYESDLNPQAGVRSRGNLRIVRRLPGSHQPPGDQAVIDGALVNGSARVVGWFAGVVRWVQSGYIYHYAFAMLLGVIVLMTYFVSWPMMTEWLRK